MTGLDFLMQCAAKGTVLLLGGFAAELLLRRKSAALRHTVWAACLAGLLTLPAAILSLPRWGVIGSPAPVTPASVITGSVSVSTVAAIPLPPPPINPALVIWMGGACAVALWFLAGILRISWMVRRAAGTADEAELAASVGIRRRVRVLVSRATSMPMTWGLLRPVVVLPQDEREWPAARRRAVLLHELVHVRRLDLLAQGIAQTACCLFWFHPLAWMAARRLRIEREQACDDAVLSLGIPAPEYAGYLMDLVRAAIVHRNAWRQAPAMAEASGLETRVRALLDRKRDRRPLDSGRAVAVAAAGIALLAPLAALSESKPVPAPQAPPAAAAQAPEPAKEQAAAAPHTVKRPWTFQGPARHRILLAEQAPSTPQVGRGSLVGTVRDPSGAVIPNCTVVLRNLEGFNQETTQSGATGQYRLDYIPAGQYSLQVTAPGFATFGLHQVRITAGDVGLINVNMALGTIATSVSVAGKKPATVTPNVASAPGRIKVGGNVQQPRLLRQARPEYPAELQQLGVEGTVTLQAVISKDGVPMSLRALSSSADPRLIPLAMNAVSQWLYSPALLNGEPVETTTTIDVTFELNQ